MSRASRAVGFFLLPGASVARMPHLSLSFSTPMMQLPAILVRRLFESVLAGWENMEMSRKVL